MYKVVKDQNMSILISDVSRLMKAGWVPTGGISYMAADVLPAYYLQAMMKHG